MPYRLVAIDGTRIYIEICLYLVPVLLHLVGLYLLYATRRTYFNHTQRLYLIALSSTELVMAILKIVQRFCYIAGAVEIGFYVWMVQTSGVFLCYILTMVLITVDRFLEVYLNLRYPLICTKRRTGLALLVTLMLSTVLAIVLCSTYGDFETAHIVMALYFWPTTEITFIIVAVFTYSYLFTKIRANRYRLKQLVKQLPRMRSETDEAVNRRRNLKHIKKRFFLPSLLIATFVLFWFLPDLGEFIFMLKGVHVTSSQALIINIGYVLAMSSDALIYVFSSIPVRSRLLKYIGRRRISVSFCHSNI